MAQFLRKSQLSLEFTIAVCLGFLILISTFSFAVYENKAMTQRKTLMQLDDITYDIKSELDAAELSHDGYFREFEIDKNKYGLDYSISVKNKMMSVYAKKASAELYVPNFTGNLQFGKNSIRKTDGAVYVNQ